jgi:hypothetical protein
MDVRIDELNTTLDTMSAEALLTPDVLARIVAAVRASQGRDAARESDRAADLDTRSIVDQQRAGKR